MSLKNRPKTIFCDIDGFSNIEFIELKSTYTDLNVKIQKIIKNRVNEIINDICW